MIMSPPCRQHRWAQERSTFNRYKQLVDNESIQETFFESKNPIITFTKNHILILTHTFYIPQTSMSFLRMEKQDFCPVGSGTSTAPWIIVISTCCKLLLSTTFNKDLEKSKSQWTSVQCFPKTQWARFYWAELSFTGLKPKYMNNLIKLGVKSH